MDAMPTRTRNLDEARRHWQRTRQQIGDELRAARHVLGITQLQVGAGIGVSQPVVSRRERGRVPHLAGDSLAVHAAALGLKLSVRLWPVGGGLRDAAQARYIATFLARVGRPWKVTLEAPIPIAGDVRAVDILLSGGGVRIAVEVITRLTDLQAQLRAAELKAREIRATRLLVVLAGTHANRAALAQARPTLLPSFELDSRRLMRLLAAGQDPGRDGIVLLSA